MTINPVTDWDVPSAINHVECDLIKLRDRIDLTDLERTLVKTAYDVLTNAWLSAYERQKATEDAASLALISTTSPQIETQGDR